MTAALYARVSTKDKGQDTDNQLIELRAFAARLGYPVYKEYADEESGTTADRPQFEQLFIDAHQRRFDVVLFWALDRFSREGVTETLLHLRKLSAAGVRFKSFTEPHVDVTQPFGEALIGFMAAIAQQESVRRGERTRTGMARARAQGTKSGKAIGRPALPVATVARIQELRSEGWSFRRISQEVGVPVATVHQYATPPASAVPTPAPAGPAGESET